MRYEPQHLSLGYGKDNKNDKSKKAGKVKKCKTVENTDTTILPRKSKQND